MREVEGTLLGRKSEWAVSFFTRRGPWMVAAAPARVCFSHCCCSVAKSCSTLTDPMGCSTPGSFVLHYPLEFAQIHVH